MLAGFSNMTGSRPNTHTEEGSIMNKEFVDRELVIEKIEPTGPHQPVQWWLRFADRKVSKAAVKITQSHHHCFCLYAFYWADGDWHVFENLYEAPNKLLAFCYASTWLENDRLAD